MASYLDALGVDDVFGAELSAEMVAEARRRSPDIGFRQEDVLSLSLPDASVGGIAAFYAIVHFTPPQAEQAFREMRRVLLPAGYALASFHLTEMASPPPRGTDDYGRTFG